MIRSELLKNGRTVSLVLKVPSLTKLSSVNNNCMDNVSPNAPHVLVDFVVFHPGHGRSVTDF